MSNFVFFRDLFSGMLWDTDLEGKTAQETPSLDHKSSAVVLSKCDRRVWMNRELLSQIRFKAKFTESGSRGKLPEKSIAVLLSM